MVAAAAGAAFALAQPARYTASAQVAFARANTPTQATVAATPAMAARAIGTPGVHGLTARSLLAESSVSADPTSQVLIVRVSDTSKPRASRLASAYARAIVASRRARIAAIDGRPERRLRHELSTLHRAVTAAPSPARYVTRSRYATALRQLAALQTTEATTARGVYVAGVPGAASQNGRPVAREAATGLLAGLAVGGLLLMLLAATRRRAGDRLAEELGTPVLGELPDSIVMAGDPRRQLRSRPVGDAIREVRSRLIMARMPHSSTIAIAGAQDSRHTAPTTLGLAFGLAEIGRRVSVVDLDAHGNPALHWWMRIDAEPGLADVLSGHARIVDVLVSYDRGGTPTGEFAHAASGVRVLPAGHTGENPWDMVSSPALEDAIRHLRRDSDVVLIACPPLLGGTVTSAIVGLSDGVVTVVDPGMLDGPAIEDLRAALDMLPTNPLGVVLVDPMPLGAHARPRTQAHGVAQGEA
jgi:Mrp family chromosome partitioning ATPase/capsular polysaccharide biosynthesis protein